MKLAFYDFDGTLASSNVVTRYLYFARRRPSRLESFYRTVAAVGGVPLWLLLDMRSRAAFNRQFFRLYGGIPETWLRDAAETLFEEEERPKIYPGTPDLLRRDREQGYRLVMVSGGLEFALRGTAEALGFDDLLANKMLFSDGIATGRLQEPLLAEAGKTKAIHDYCREHDAELNSLKAYSDSYSDLAMLEMAALPAAVNPDKKLRVAAIKRGWPVLSTRNR